MISKKTCEHHGMQVPSGHMVFGYRVCLSVHNMFGRLTDGNIVNFKSNECISKHFV